MTEKINKIVIDLDGTITFDDPSLGYPDKLANPKIEVSMRNAATLGYEVVIHTARNMRTYDGDIRKIHQYTKPVAETWLDNQGIKYNDIVFGKPWSGYEGWYVDDKNLSLEEFIFKFSGPYWNKSVDVIVPFFNESQNVINVHSELIKIQRLLNIGNFIYVDNGSSDETRKYLHELKRRFENIRIVCLEKNEGYGYGILKGIAYSGADYVFINHGDGQFDGYAYLINNMSSIMGLETSKNLIPVRCNRAVLESIQSYLLRTIVSALMFQKLADFNGQPKFFQKSDLRDLNRLPYDYCIDLAIYLDIKKNGILLPVIQRDRSSGTSSWANSLTKRIAIFLGYIRYALSQI